MLGKKTGMTHIITVEDIACLKSAIYKSSTLILREYGLVGNRLNERQNDQRVNTAGLSISVLYRSKNYIV